ncbi:MAG: hypothetical protein EPN94_01535 [Nitrospirae bacterium]|nr:MAG: hypothetical protein EPN94_01535 [Nitrospirota bacterium]
MQLWRQDEKANCLFADGHCAVFIFNGSCR